MRRRLFFTLPDIPTARTILDELLLARIDERHIHFLGQRDTLPPELPEASFLQKTDFLHALRTGAMVGAAAGVAGGAVMWLYPPQSMVIEPSLALIAGIVGALLGAWFSSMVGSSVPNSSLRSFQDAIEAGKVLLMVDVPFARVEQVHELVASHHPEAEWGGVAPQIPAFP
ncbi:MAG: DUF1269 domain-containing protein [Betaproteobacteria bacterium]|nr:DUF1269 domain-containing protein [Betaproteobacteria bacterium]